MKLRTSKLPPLINVMKRIYFLFPFVFFCTFCSSQNLVQNPSFEDTIGCPTDEGQLYNATGWFNPTQGSPDYYNACYSGGGIFDMGIPSNWIGYQNPRTGNGYSGIAVYTPLGESREYIEVRLKDTLESGKKYYVSLYVSLADSVWYGINSIGVYLSKDSIYASTYLHLPYVPQVINPAITILSDQINWKQIFGEYIAVGGEKFLTIGNFENDANTDTARAVSGGVTSQSLLSYYFIDDVCISDSPDTCNIILSSSNYIFKTPIEIFPNPAADFVYVKININELTKITVRNNLGVLVYEKNSFDGLNKIDLSFFSAGLYFINISANNTLITRKIIHLKQ